MTIRGITTNNKLNGRASNLWRIWLSFRLSVVFLCLAGGANALAAVQCVNTTSPGCTVATTFTTIQAAVTAAVPGDLILVGAGAYHETVQVPPTKPGLVLLGAQAGVDARTGRGTPSKESVVSAALSGPLNAGFIVQAPNVIIDGFTIQNANDPLNQNDSAIDLKGGATPANGAKILDNILQNNGQALSLNFEGAAPVQNVLVQHNLFRNNNVVSGLKAAAGDEPAKS